VNQKKIMLVGEAWGELNLTGDYVALVDNEDLERLSKYTWCAVKRKSGDIHVMRKNSNNRTVFLHHEVLGLLRGPITYVIDHENRNGLDNRKSNLRRVSRRVNALNSDRSDNAKLIEKHGNRFRVRPYVNGKRTVIGSFETLTEAEQAVRRYRETQYNADR
jgi:hypothetical protein